MLELAYEKIFQAVGRMGITMLSMMGGFLTNIVLDPLLIFGPGFFPELGIAGAACATGIGQCVTLFLYILCYRLHLIPIKMEKKHLRLERKMAVKLYAIGIPAILNMALPSLLISALNGILAAFSEKYVLVLGVYYKLQTFIYMTANGIIQGIRPLIGYNYGAGESGRVKKIFRTTLSLTMGVMFLGSVLSWAIPRQLIGLFTSNAETVQTGVTALNIISLGFCFSEFISAGAAYAVYKKAFREKEKR